MNRGLKCIVAGVVLVVISYAVSISANNYVMNGTVGQSFRRIGNMQKFYAMARLAKLGGLATGAAGGAMLIVDSSPRRRRKCTQ